MADEAKKGDTVKVHYTGKLDDGTVFDSSEGREPLEFTLGEQQVIPGFEEAVEGMKVGDSKTTTIPSDQAYGPYNDEMVLQVDRSRLPAGAAPQVGDEMQVRTPDGTVIPVVIVDVAENAVTIDANHPLAGQNLTFDLDLVEITPKSRIIMP